MGPGASMGHNRGPKFYIGMNGTTWEQFSELIYMYKLSHEM